MTRARGSISLCGLLCLVVSLGPTRSVASVSDGDPWLAAAVENIQRSEYEFSLTADAAWIAPSRSQGLINAVSAEGLRVAPRPAGSAAWEIELQLVGFGRGDLLDGPGPVSQIVGDGHRVELRRQELTEWYVNLPGGLEQGFVLPRRPAGSANEPLVLEMRVGGGATADLSDDGREVLFRAASGKAVLRYDKLAVFDAGGRAVSSRLELADARLRIVVEDAAATYPLLVDPLVTNPDWSAEGNQANAEFGKSVASAGDVNGDGYDDVIVGARTFNNEGRAYVFYGSPGGPSTTPSWTAEPGQLLVEFGETVASAGDVNGDGYDDVIIGASEYDDLIDNDEGWVFVFHGSPSGLSGGLPTETAANADWTAEGNQDESEFGRRVRGAGDINGDGYDDVLIGAPQYSNGQQEEGVALAFYGSASGLNGGITGTPQNAPWLTDNGLVNSEYGHALAGAGDVNNDGYDDVIIGARRHFVDFEDEGRVYLFLGSSGGLATTPVWTQDGGQSDMRFGVSVTGAGDVNGDGYDDVLIGADGYSDPPDLEPAEGGAFVFYGNASGLLGSTPAWITEGNQTDAFYGFAVATTGDVNADGYGDIVVGADTFDNGNLDEGAAFLYLGSENGLPLTPSRQMEIEQDGARFGHSLGGGGDFNNDGYDDLLVGGHQFTKLQLEEGGAFAFFGCEDTDLDGSCQADDNCPEVANPDQLDTDGDNIGNVCDPCEDADLDGVCDAARTLVESSGPGEQVVVEFGSFMRYLANEEFVDPGIVLEWTQLVYPDELSPPWASGFYGVGYETDPLLGAQNLLTTTEPPNPGTVSVFSRSTFSIPSGTDVDTLFLGVDYDDGYIAWINGVEVFRSPEMPNGVPLWNTKPTTGHESSNATQPNYGDLHDVSASGIPVLNIGGSNVLAIGVWNLSQGSSDLVLVPRLSMNRPKSTTMSYLANATDPGLGASWTQTGFDELAQGWTGGNYGVGYETGTGAEDLINTGISPSSLSVFTRARFSVDPDIVDSLFVGFDYDDGYVAWINGTEVKRSPEMPGLPGEDVDWNASPSEHESSNGSVPDYGTLMDITGAPLFLGENVLAVGVWRNGLGGTDDLVVVPRLSINEGEVDNCVGVFNPVADCDGSPGTPDEQCDLDGDGFGDECDPDIDGDGFNNGVDNCPLISNVGQSDADGDLVGDVCDSCPDDSANDADADGICSGVGFGAPKVGDQDNCPAVANPPADCDGAPGTPDEQCDLDVDGLGDACDPDIDGDGVLNESDNCVFADNLPQTDSDLDDVGDACDCADGNDQAWEIAGAIDTLRMVRSDICQNFTCSETSGACVADSDCAFDVCENKACTGSLGACDTDADCEVDECDNFTCSFSGGACVVDAECTGDFCDNRFCSQGGNPPCTGNADCTADFCQNMNCLAPPFEPCTSNFDCDFGAGTCIGSCSIGTNPCFPGGEQCVADTCGDGTCVNGGAVCSDDSACGQDFCLGLCTVGMNSCPDDSACTAAQVDLCQGDCSIGPNMCGSDLDCTAPQTDLCEGNCTIGGNACAADGNCIVPPVDTLFWQEPAVVGGTGVVYDTLRSPISSDFTTPATCVETDGADRITSDATTPAPGGIVYYLVRIENECPEGNMATDSAGDPRTGLVCE